jgi:hypothetical protein
MANLANLANLAKMAKAAKQVGIPESGAQLGLGPVMNQVGFENGKTGPVSQAVSGVSDDE